MSPSRWPALAARVAPLRSAQHGFDAELALRVPSDIHRVAEAVDLVTRHVEAYFCDRRTVHFNLRVAFGEALANAILYGNQSDPAKQDAVPDPTRPDRIAAPSGRGIFLIRHLMDEVRFNSRGNVICMILRRA